MTMNIADSLVKGASYYPDRKALIFGGEAYTYAKMNKIVDGVAGYLASLGLSKGDRLCLYMPNRPEWIMFYYGAVRIGGIVVCVPSAFKREEARGLINDSSSSILVTSSELMLQIPPSVTIPSVRKIIVVDQDEEFRSVLTGGSEYCWTAGTNTIGDDVAAVLYTGGTTGTPKGAMLMHRNILFNAQNIAYHERLRSEDAGVCFMPLSHVFAQCHILNPYLYSGCAVALFPGFDIDKVMNAVDEHGITRFYAVPTVYIRLLNHPECTKLLKNLRYVFSAATSMPGEIARQWTDLFNLPIHEAYGMTETAACVTYNHMYRYRAGSVGTPAGVVEVKIFDAQDNELKPGERGEIVIRGPNVMKGYIARPEETTAAFRNGWFHSGDVGILDDEGYVYIVDRIKDVIVTGGENVYPREVEDVLISHTAVNECAVVGLPDPEFGEAVTAFVTLKTGAAVDARALVAFCKEKIASYKAPKKVHVLPDLPRTPVGKILKRELKKSSRQRPG
jgi:long-chain acyl-CoA synthetase